jgi:hypothetical protein
MICKVQKVYLKNIFEHPSEDYIKYVQNNFDVLNPDPNFMI